MNVNSVGDICSFLGRWQAVARPFENLVSRQTGDAQPSQELGSQERNRLVAGKLR